MVAGSVALLAPGYLLWGTLVVTIFVLADLVDGAMARARGYGTDFGVVLDASCDRIADGALFGALAFYAFSADQRVLGVAALICLVTGQVISYVKARADSVNLKIGGAIAERAERNVLGLLGAGLAGLGVPHALDVCLWLLGSGRPGHRCSAAGPGAPGSRQGGCRYRPEPRHRPSGAMTPGRRRDGCRFRPHNDPGAAMTTGLFADRWRTGSPPPASERAGRWSKHPEPVAERLFREAADTAFRRRGPSVIQLARNMHRVLGEQSTPESLSAVVQAGMRSYARYWRETFRLPAMDHDEVFAQIDATVIGAEHIERAVAEGRGIMMPVTHSGNWDIAGLWATRRWGTMSTVAERLKPESLFEKFVAYRESLGMEILPLTGGASPSQILRERLKAGGIVALVGDRDLSASGVPVSFFGETAKMPPGPRDARRSH